MTKAERCFKNNTWSQLKKKLTTWSLFIDFIEGRD